MGRLLAPDDLSPGTRNLSESRIAIGAKSRATRNRFEASSVLKLRLKLTLRWDIFV